MLLFWRFASLESRLKLKFLYFWQVLTCVHSCTHRGFRGSLGKLMTSQHCSPTGRTLRPQLSRNRRRRQNRLSVNLDSAARCAAVAQLHVGRYSTVLSGVLYSTYNTKMYDRPCTVETDSLMDSVYIIMLRGSDEFSVMHDYGCSHRFFLVAEGVEEVEEVERMKEHMTKLGSSKRKRV